ncbi:hypothetical protein [uncultured Thiodictyon sp.]|jgi:hypothetical protein|uniref:hypothetical protein n=1 Tax=uncultured Thiodictyon sp. TaxID=1846217 RepID=UPI0025D51CC1|nr:hypothetical protein [uncultured Thiodictyon sp.]
MKRRPSVRKHQDLSLVPLADMITNTVGIVLFILIFTVLATSGAVVAKQFPMERETQAHPLYFICTGNRIVVAEAGVLTEEFMAGIEKLESFAQISAWVEKFNARKVEKPDVTVTGLAVAKFEESSDKRTFTPLLAVEMTPAPDAGETVGELLSPTSRFRRLLGEYDPAHGYFAFLVRPDSIEVFQAVRNLVASAGFSVGWNPLSGDDPIRFSFSGGGAQLKPQN